MKLRDTFARLRPHLGAAAPAAVLVGLMLVWAIENGGYDPATWSWGGLVALSVAGVLALRLGLPRDRALRFALIAFAGYVAWSYLSIAWADSPGDALQGSNRALVYLLVFTGMAYVPWTASGARLVLAVFVVAVDIIALVLLVRFAGSSHIGGLIHEGRLSAPTGYFNATAALFTMAALTGTSLAASSALPGELRGMLLGGGTATLLLAVIVQSRGWLFTLPLLLIAVVLITPNRGRLIVAAILPTLATLAVLHPFLAVYRANGTRTFVHAAAHAGKLGLIASGAVVVLGAIAAWGEQLIGPVRVPRRVARAGGILALIGTITAIALGGIVATHGHPFRFISRQWHGFSHTQTSQAAGSHFNDVGSGRYDFWRVGLDAFVAHPVAGLGQDNFVDYYLPRRRTGEEPRYTHSLEIRLLAHTGLVGALLFAAFLGAALAGAIRSTRRSLLSATRAIAATAALPCLVWLIHGSLDWFWEMPALTGPALGFLAVAIRLGSPAEAETDAPVGTHARRRLRVPARARRAAIGLAVLAASMVLGVPYIALREVSRAAAEEARDPVQALAELQRAADLNPLDAGAPQQAGALALRNGLPNVAATRFAEAIRREPGGWFNWLGAGLAASTQGDAVTAQRDYARAQAIDSRQPAVREAMARVATAHPLTPAQAFRLLIVV